MAVSETRIKRTRWQLAIAAALVVSACSPLPHRDGTVGGDSATMMRLGDAARDAGDPAAALPLYQRAHRLEPANLAPVIRTAETFNQLGAHHDAGDAWASVLRLHPRNFEALVGFGNTLTALNQPLAALEHFERARVIRDTPALLNGLGVAYDMLGNAEQAQEAYRQGLALAPGNLALANNLGVSLALSGDSAGAIETLEAVAAMPGAGIGHRQNLAMAYGIAGFSDRARTVGRQDLDDLTVQRNLAFYRLIDAMPDHATRVAALGARTDGALSLAGLRAPNAVASR